MDVREGTLKHGLPYLALGSGTPLVFLRWFTPTHANPTGYLRKFEIKTLTPLARHFQVYAVNRAPGVAEGTTMADIAAQHAEAIKDEFGGPVDVLGMSSGGSVALQLAADHPGAVRRLAIAGSGYKLGAAAKSAQLRWAEAAAKGRRGMHYTAPVASASALRRRLSVPMLWLMDPLMRPKNPADMLAFTLAEDAFDLGARLSEITAPTLVLAGEKDPTYPMAILRGTAEGVADGRLITYPGTGHMGTLTHKRFASDLAEFMA